MKTGELFTVTLTEAPNLDAALAAAVAKAEGEDVRELRLNSVEVELRSWYGRENRYNYNFVVLKGNEE